MIQQILKRVKQIDPPKFSVLLAIFFIITHFEHAINQPFIYILLILIASIGLLLEDIRQSTLFWVTITGLYWLWAILNWQVIDNHMYLWGYWLIAITVSKQTEDPDASLKISAKFLIATCMTYATIQKMNPEFLSGDFFYFQMITDYRFKFIGHLIQFNLGDIIQENNMLITNLKTNSRAVLLNPGPHILHIISQTLTWYTMFIETCLALVFFLPQKKCYALQHWLMLLFLSIYFILPIKGFAFALLSLGFTLIKKEDAGLKLTYILFLIYIFSFSSVVIGSILREASTYQIL